MKQSIYFTNIVRIQLCMMLLINVLIILGFSDELIAAVFLQCRRNVGWDEHFFEGWDPEWFYLLLPLLLLLSLLLLLIGIFQLCWEIIKFQKDTFQNICYLLIANVCPLSKSTIKNQHQNISLYYMMVQ